MNKQIIIFSLLLVILTMGVSAYSEINSFTKVISYNTSNHFEGGEKVLINDDYIFVHGKIYLRNLSCYNCTNTIALYSMFGDDDYYYYSPSVISTAYRIFDIPSLEINLTKSVGSNYYSHNFDRSSTDLEIIGNKIVSASSSRFGVTDKSTGNNICNTASLTGSSLGQTFLVGNDDNYFYGIAYDELLKYDYNCGLIAQYPLGFSVNFSYDGQHRYIRYDNDDSFFIMFDFTGYASPIISTFDMEGNAIDGYQFLPELTTELGEVINNISQKGTPTSATNNYLNILNECAYDEDNNVYYCAFYMNSNTSNFAVASFDINFDGTIADMKVYNHVYFNDAGLDSYTISQTNESFLFVDNDTLFIQLHDTISNTYDVFSGTPTIINEIEGLTCNSDYTLCYSITSTCFTNDDFYTGFNASNWICLNTTYNNGLYCNQELQLCSGGCTNILATNPYGFQYYTGTCYNATCTNDCTINGQVYSDTPTTYKQCGNYDADGCLEWSTSIPCGTGNVSINGICKSVNTTAIYGGLTGFQVAPMTNQTKNIDLSKTPPLAEYETENSFINVKLGTTSANQGDYYILRKCDFNSTQLYYHTDPITSNLTNISFTGFAEGNYLVNFENNSNNVIIYGRDALSKDIFIYNISKDYNNVTLEDEVRLRLEDGTIIVSISEPPTNIANINIEVITITSLAGTYTSAKMTVYKVSGGSESVYGYNVPKIDATASNLFYVFVAGTNVIVNRQSVISTPIYSSGNINVWTATNNNVYKDCYYTTIGCRTVRTYYSDYDDYFMWNTRDWTVCIDRLGASALPELDDEGGFGSKLSPTTKILVALLSMFLIFIIITVIGIATDKVSIFAFVGTFFAVGFGIYYAIIGWLPAWAIFIMILIASFVVMMFFRALFIGKDEM